MKILFFSIMKNRLGKITNFQPMLPPDFNTWPWIEFYTYFHQKNTMNRRVPKQGMKEGDREKVWTCVYIFSLKHKQTTVKTQTNKRKVFCLWEKHTIFAVIISLGNTLVV